MDAAKPPRPLASRINAKQQITLPAQVMQAAGFEVGDRLIARVDGPGQITLVGTRALVEGFAGSLTGIYVPSYLDRLRDEWD